MTFKKVDDPSVPLTRLKQPPVKTVTENEQQSAGARAREARRRRFEVEVDRLMDRLYGTALRLTRDPDDAEDVVAEAVSKAWSRLDELRDLDKLPGWLFRILSTTFITEWRRRQARQKGQSELENAVSDEMDGGDFSLFQKLHQPFLLWWAGPEEQFLNDLLQEDIQRAIDSLPDAFRITVVLVEVQGYTYEEVAQLLEVPLGTIRSRLSRARSMLQRALWEQARDAGLTPQAPGPSPRDGGRP